MTGESIGLALLSWLALGLPGALLVWRRSVPLWTVVAGAFASVAGLSLIVALVAAAVPGRQDSWLIFPLALIGSLLAARLNHDNLRRGSIPAIDPWCFVPALAATGIAASVHAGAIDTASGNASFNAYFNADFFKHLAHTHAVAHHGLPPPDLFNNGEPLHYYWLYYVLPGSAAALFDVGGSLIEHLSGFGLVQTFLFWILAHGLCRAAGANGPMAALVSTAAMLGLSLDGLWALAATGWNWTEVVTVFDVEHMGRDFVRAMSLFRLNLYIPQHQMALACLVAWLLLRHDAASGGTVGSRTSDVVRLMLLVAAPAFSVFIGAMALVLFGLLTLTERRRGLGSRLVRIGGAGAAAVATVLVLGIVQPELGHSSLEGPLFASEPWKFPAVQRGVVLFVGLIPAFGGLLILGVAGFIACRTGDVAPETRGMRSAGLLMLAVGVGTALLVAVAISSQRLALEIQLRAGFFTALGLMIGTAALLSAPRRGIGTKAVFASGLVLVIAGLMTPILDHAWHTTRSARWTTTVPEADIQAIAWMRENTTPGEIVLQYPEHPFLRGGRDAWVPVFAGRAVPATVRATRWDGASMRYDLAVDFFAGNGNPQHPALGGIRVVYLSRALHPATYEALVSALADTPGWRAPLCGPDVCILRRIGGP